MFERLLKTLLFVGVSVWGLECYPVWGGREGWRGPGSDSSKQAVDVSPGPHINCA